MSTINIGDISNATFKVGAVDCSIYLGDVKLYPSGTPSFDCKYKFILSDSSVVSAECDSTSAITTNDTSAYALAMVEAELGNCVTSIGEKAFYHCGSLTSCTIGSGVTSIGDSAFRSCSSITSVTVNATVPPTLGGYAFFNANNCPIYVPSASVENYKTAWSTYADRIQAIS